MGRRRRDAARGLVGLASASLAGAVRGGSHGLRVHSLRACTGAGPAAGHGGAGGCRGACQGRLAAVSRLLAVGRVWARVRTVPGSPASLPPAARLPLQRQCTAPYRAPELWDVPSSCTLGEWGRWLLSWQRMMGASWMPGVAAVAAGHAGGAACPLSSASQPHIPRPPPPARGSSGGSRASRQKSPLLAPPLHPWQTSEWMSGPWDACSTT